MTNNSSLVLFPASFNGVLKAPTSKSYMQRVLALALLHPGITKIVNPGKSADDLAAMSIIQNLGAIISWEDDVLVVKGVSAIASNKLHAGESGLSLRMFTPIAALAQEAITITGEGSLAQRPMGEFENTFAQLQVGFKSVDGKLPLLVEGPIVPTDIDMDGSLSSQFLTGFLIALSFAAKKQTTISVHNLKSKPYISLTLALLEQFGYDVKNENFERFIITPTPRTTQEITTIVEGDWSGAAFLLVAGAISGKVTVQGLSLKSEQADKKIMEALYDSKALVTVDENVISIEPSELQAFIFDATDCPDLFPPLVALAACCKGNTVIKGVSRLKHKESDRAAALTKEFGILGVKISINDDLMNVEGAGEINGGKVSSHHDHRIAMATALMSAKAGAEIEISDAMAVTKSYPHFYEDLKKLGAIIKTQASE